MWLTAAKINLSEQIESGSSHSPSSSGAYVSGKDDPGCVEKSLELKE